MSGNIADVGSSKKKLQWTMPMWAWVPSPSDSSSRNPVDLALHVTIDFQGELSTD
jgi:hypothetical protein